MNKYLLILLIGTTVGVSYISIGCRTQQNFSSSRAVPSASHFTPTPATRVTIGVGEASCPVMGTVMKKSAMIPMQHNGTTTYVCCKECQAKFNANPDRYLTHPAPLTRDMPD